MASRKESGMPYIEYYPSIFIVLRAEAGGADRL
jgi:hypothetical protein